jgi:hypothetical protein
VSGHAFSPQNLKKVIDSNYNISATFARCAGLLPIDAGILLLAWQLISAAPSLLLPVFVNT